jgi:hypothetical protein
MRFGRDYRRVSVVNNNFLLPLAKSGGEKNNGKIQKFLNRSGFGFFASVFDDFVSKAIRIFLLMLP